MDRLHNARLVLSLLLLLAVSGAAGCSPTASSVTSGPNAATSQKPEAAAALAKPASTKASPSIDAATSYAPPAVDPLAAVPAKKEIWEAHSMRGARVGYGHTSVREVVENGEALERTRHDSLLSLVREGQPIEQRIQLTSWETPEGELRRFETRLISGGGELQATGQVRDGQLTVETTTVGKTSRQTIPWQLKWGGFTATERSLAAQPLKPGEKRSVTGLLPVFHIPGETQLEAAPDYEQVGLPTIEKKLLKIRSVVSVGGQTMESYLWVDEQGETWKSLMPGIEQEAIRTTREAALSGGKAAPLDLIVASIVPLRGKLPQGPFTQRVVYQAKVTQGKIDGVFANCLSQRVIAQDDQSAKLEIIAVRPAVPEQPGAQVQPSADDRSPNNLIQSDDPRVVELAAAVAPEEQDPWLLACRLEQFVHKSVHKKNFSQAFATAAEVAEKREGDCTEHAVLLAALCRARSIPARVAFGLVYYPPQQGFAYHMWNEVWIADRWIPLDGTLGIGGIGGDHVKLADSSLQGSTAYSAMLPVIQVFGRLELEVLEAE